MGLSLLYENHQENVVFEIVFFMKKSGTEIGDSPQFLKYQMLRCNSIYNVYRKKGPVLFFSNFLTVLFQDV